MNATLDSLRRSFETFGFIPHSTSSMLDIALMKEQTGMNEFYEVSDPTGRLKGVGLRVDHTVPLMRFVEENRNRIVFPFKRYTTQKVFRPQEEGGFNEFHSCDIDVVGEKKLHLIYDAEIIALIYKSFMAIGIHEGEVPAFRIHINNRKFINGFFKRIGISEKDIPTLQKALSKKDLSSLNAVTNKEQTNALTALLDIKGSNEEVLLKLTEISISDQEKVGIKELINVCDYAKQLGISEEILTIDPAMTRNMSYYTGNIFTTYLKEYPEIGSICHGGRYRSGNREANYFHGVGVTIHLSQLFTCLV